MEAIVYLFYYLSFSNHIAYSQNKTSHAIYNKTNNDKIHRKIPNLIIRQIFSLARDWSKRVKWANIPQFSKLRALRKRFEG